MQQGWKGKLKYQLTENGEKKELLIHESGVAENSDIRIEKEWTESNGYALLSIKAEPYKALMLKEMHIERRVPENQVDTVYMNGFQTWTESHEWSSDERMQGLRRVFFPWIKKYHLKNYGDYSFASYRPEHIHGYSWCYFRNPEQLLFIGSVSERLGYTRFVWFRRQRVLRIERECEGLELKESAPLLQLLITRGDEATVFDTYFNAMNVDCTAPYISGWTSWYQHYTHITPDIVRRNLREFKRLNIPIQVFQLDDGWERAIGDWLEPDESFDGQMSQLAHEVTAAGYTPGLWIAPFLVEEESHIFQDHPEWCVADEDGVPLVLGYIPFHWKGRFYALDLYNTGVREYLREVFRRAVQDWGFRFLKLDFLYGVARVPHSGRSRGMIMDDAMEFLRTISGDTVLLGCGVPLAPAAGRVEYCRIGADVAPVWEDRRLKLLGYRERVSTVNSLRSTIGRRQLNGRAFVNDPDVYILRSEQHNLNREEQYTLFLVNRVYGGLLFTSDNPGDYTDEQLQLYLSQFPLRKVKLLYSDQRMARFRIEEREYILFHNLHEQKAEHYLEPGLYYSSLDGFSDGGLIEIPPHASRCFLQVGKDAYVVAGSTGQLLPGSEIVDFAVTQSGIHFSVHPDTRNKGLIYIKVPSHVSFCNVNGVQVEAEEKVDMNLLVIEKA